VIITVSIYIVLTTNKNEISKNDEDEEYIKPKQTQNKSSTANNSICSDSHSRIYNYIKNKENEY